jgi:division/cell wall cluster transcriptional repressor MraZ
VTPLFLCGQYEVACDSKNRVLIPAEIRDSISPAEHGKDFFLVVGDNGRPWLYPDLYYRWLGTNLEEKIAPNAKNSDFDRLFFGFAHKVKTDGQGRILIPAHAMAWAKIEKQPKFVFVCLKNRIEIWDAAGLEKERDSLIARRNEIAGNAPSQPPAKETQAKGPE